MRVTDPNEIAMLEMEKSKSDTTCIETTSKSSLEKTEQMGEGEDKVLAIVKSIDEALGPTTYYNWMLSADTITSTMSLPLAGGLSDIFGRRMFIIAGGFVSLLAAIIALAAGNLPTVIASAAVAGLGSGSQQLALAAVSELVPNNMRSSTGVSGSLDIALECLRGSNWQGHHINSDAKPTLTQLGGAMVVYHGKYGFRINFIIGVVLNTISIGAAWIWYHPPSQGAKLGNRTKMQAFKDLDWTGVGIMNIGITLMLVAVGIDGTTVSWSSPALIAVVAISILSLAVFWLWEAKFARNPFMARELFAGKARTFTAFLLIDFVVGMVLYAAAFWAQLLRGLWQGDPIKVGVLYIPGGIGGATSQQECS
ncbi:Neutral ceramidase B [Venturia nashicola]|nr:Neutral ceramidase B [Venturia nashicola]